MKHDWVINAISEGESWMAGVAATCGACGLIRTKAISTAHEDDRIDLTGDCEPSGDQPSGPLVIDGKPARGMSRPDPMRIIKARRAAMRSRLIGAGLLPDVADAWIAH